MKQTLVVLLLAFMCVGSASSCPKKYSPKIYYLDSTEGALIRTQDDEKLMCTDPVVEGHRCLSEPDWEYVLNLIKSCEDVK